MEKRKFGRTGLETSLLGFGGFHLLEIPYQEAEYLLNAYLDAGGNYVETAAGYGDGASEIKIGRAISKRRSEYILASKTGERSREGFTASLDRSLEYLNTDHLDLMLMHAVGTRSELDSILAPGGAMEGFIEAQSRGKVRFAGISMHGQPDMLIEALRQYPFDAVMTTINYYDRFNFPEIEEMLVPLAMEKETAVILMKPLADGFLWKSAPAAFRYAFGQPVSVVVSGINTRGMLESDIKYAEEFIPFSDREKEELYRTAPELGDYVCRQCNKCLPCPQGLNIPEIFKYEGCFDRQMANGIVTDPAEYALRERLRFWFGNRQLAVDKYAGTAVKANACTGCGECTAKCPYGIDIVRKLEIADYKLAGKKIF
jgi:predicted aldo/keto reductase-like oxidoreductase